jgi:hypothetical protein
MITGLQNNVFPHTFDSQSDLEKLMSALQEFGVFKVEVLIG